MLKTLKLVHLSSTPHTTREYLTVATHKAFSGNSSNVKTRNRLRPRNAFVSGKPKLEGEIKLRKYFYAFFLFP